MFKNSNISFEKQIKSFFLQLSATATYEKMIVTIVLFKKFVILECKNRCL